MALIKDIQDKNYVGLKDYVGEKIASIIANKISQKKDEFLATVRGMSEKSNPFEKKDDDKKDDDKKEVVKPEDKKSDDDNDEDDEDKGEKKE